MTLRKTTVAGGFPGHCEIEIVACYGPDYSRSPVKFSNSWKMLMKLR